MNNINIINDIIINNTDLSTTLIHEIFDYIHPDYKLLIHREGSSDQQRAKLLSINLIMTSGMENEFEDVLLCRRFKSKLCTIAAKRGYINTLRWARDHRCGWIADTCKAAAEGGHLDCLIWLREHGCAWDKREMCNAAAKSGNVSCMKWLREQGCLWSAKTCRFAAWEGHFDCLMWLREHGCEWDSDTCLSAARGGYFDCLIWAREHGCPWDPLACKQVAQDNNNIDIVEWITSQGI